MMRRVCPQGRIDYEACFAPFRYCPVKGCGHAEGGVQLPVEGEPARPASCIGETYISWGLSEPTEDIDCFAECNGGSGGDCGWRVICDASGLTADEVRALDGRHAEHRRKVSS